MDGLTALWNRWQGDEVAQPAHIRLADDHVVTSSGATSGSTLEADRCYFSVRLAEVFLHDRSTWWQTYVPSIWTSTSFGYAGAQQDVPYLVGPHLLSGNDLGVPEGMLYRNEMVAGLHPFRGGTLTFSAVLNRVTAKDRAQDVLSLVETTTSAFDVATQLVPYVGLAKSLTKGLELLLDMGSKPLIGVRDSVAGVGGGVVRSGWYALVDRPTKGQPLQRERLWATDDGLLAGETPDSAGPVRDRNYLLYSIDMTPRRDDVDNLAELRGLRARVMEFAQRPGGDSWKTAKATMVELGVALLEHPDLITPQADELFRSWRASMVELHEERVLRAPKSAAGEPGPALSAVDSDIRSIASLVLDL